MASSDGSLLMELECPVCMEYMEPPIVICENGHSICNPCKQKLEVCPTCRKPFLDVRNRALESIFRVAVMSSEHKQKCPFEDCSWSGPLSNLPNHMRISHRSPTDSHESENGEFTVILTDVCPTRKYRKVLFALDEVFYATWKFEDENMYCTVLFVGNDGKASQYAYKFSLVDSSGLRNVSMTFPMNSVIVDVNDILKPGNCVLLHYKTVVHFLNPNKELSCNLGVYSSEQEKCSKSSPHNPSKTSQFLALVGSTRTLDNTGRRHRGGRGGRRKERRGLSEKHSDAEFHRDVRGRTFDQHRSLSRSMSDLLQDDFMPLEGSKSPGRVDKKDSRQIIAERKLIDRISSLTSKLKLVQQKALLTQHINPAALEGTSTSTSSSASYVERNKLQTKNSLPVENIPLYGELRKDLYAVATAPDFETLAEEGTMKCSSKTNVSSMTNDIKENLAQNHPSRLSDIQPVAPFLEDASWKCALCGYSTARKPPGVVSVRPLETNWRCPMCGEWRV